MATSPAVQVYARALFDIATAAEAVDEVGAGMAEIVEAVRSHSGLRETLIDAVVPGTKKRDILREVFAETVAPEAVAITAAMVERGHASLVDEVADAFRAIAEKERGIVVAEVTTAIPLDDELRASVTSKLAASLGRPVTLRERVDSTILGGIRIKVAGRVLDGSLSARLAAVRTTLSTTPQGGES